MQSSNSKENGQFGSATGGDDWRAGQVAAPPHNPSENQQRLQEGGAAHTKQNGGEQGRVRCQNA